MRLAYPTQGGGRGYSNTWIYENKMGRTSPITLFC